MSTINRELRRYRPAVALEAFLPKRLRRILEWILIAVISVLIIGEIFFVLRAAVGDSVLSLRSVLLDDAHVLTGLILMLASVLFVLLALSWYYNTLYFRGLERIIHEKKENESGVTYEVAGVLLSDRNDVTRSFLRSSYGTRLMLRLGVTRAQRDAFLTDARTTLGTNNISLPEGAFMTLRELGMFLFEQDESLRSFLAGRGVTEEIFRGALHWVMRSHYEAKHSARWWSRDNLGKKPGIGRAFSYGVAYTLEKFLRDVQTGAVFSTLSSNAAYADEKIEEIVTILARAQEANVVLVGEEGVGKTDLLVRLGQKMQRGEVVGSDKRIVVFDADSFIATYSNKETFERNFLKMFLQAEHAGNLIVVIERFGKFLKSAASLGVDAMELMNRFLSSPNLHLIVTASPNSYHQNIESNPQIAQRFEAVRVESPSLDSTVRVLEGVAEEYEKNGSPHFTYAAVNAIAVNADERIVEGVMPDKAVDLLIETVPVAHSKGAPLITKDIVDGYVSTKTGIPLGPIGEEERDVLMNLEDILHKRVIGQDHAIDAISSAMRRSRAGIQSRKRPIGSFLFLGSTGVGKTETAKALAEVFFGSDEKMSRIDMSEFSGGDALSRIIGSGSTSGTLANMLRENPYGVLLLDEFEKGSSSIHDLFLQILDEGVFTDAQGREVNARNSIIIATSNAGSDLIWRMVEEKTNPTERTDELIDSIVQSGSYKPELINRFDGVIVFEPLNTEHTGKIASLMLEKLKERVKKQGYELVINDALVHVLVQKGYNPQFGARPMNRAIQDIVEEKIAEKIIAGGLKQGDQIIFSETDFAG